MAENPRFLRRERARNGAPGRFDDSDFFTALKGRSLTDRLSGLFPRNHARFARWTDECVRPYTIKIFYVRLLAAYGQAVYADCGGGYRAAEFQVAGDFVDVEEQLFQIAGYRDFFHRIG